VVPALVIAAAEQTVVVDAAAVVDVGQVVTDATDVREVDVLLHDTLTATDERRPVLSPRHCNAVPTSPSYNTRSAAIADTARVTISK